MRHKIGALAVLVCLLLGACSQQKIPDKSTVTITEHLTDNKTDSGMVQLNSEKERKLYQADSKMNLTSTSRKIVLALKDEEYIYLQAATNDPIPGGGMLSYVLWKEKVGNAGAEKAQLGEINFFTINQDWIITEDNVFFVVTELSADPVSDNPFVNVIYQLSLKGESALREVYRDARTLPGAYIELYDSYLLIRQAEREGERYSTWLELYDPIKQKLMTASGKYTSINGLGQYLMNISVDNDIIYGVFSERDQADEEHETPAILIFNENLEETGRIQTNAVKDYMINTYPYHFQVSGSNVMITNGNQNETLFAVIENGSLKELGREQQYLPAVGSETGSSRVYVDLRTNSLRSYDYLTQEMTGTETLFPAGDWKIMRIWIDNDKILFEKRTIKEKDGIYFTYQIANLNEIKFYQGGK